MRQNGTNGVTPTRRVVLVGGLAAALWRLGARARGDTPAPAEGIFNFEAAPARLQLAPAPAEPAAAYAYAGAIPGPLVRLKQGEELRLKFANKLAEPTTLSFPGLRAANAAAGIGGLTQERLKPGDERRHPLHPPRFRLQSLSAARRLRPTCPSKGAGSSARSSSTSRRRRKSSSTRRWCYPTGMSRRTARSRTISPILPSAEEADARAASFSPMARPRR